MKIDTSNLQPVGYSELIKRYELKVMPHYRVSYITLTGRGSSQINEHVETVIYPKIYIPKNPQNPLEQLEFAIKNEGINLEIITLFFERISTELLEEFIEERLTGKYRRKIWYLYEFLTETQLNIPDIKTTPYIDLLDPKNYYTANSIKSKRHAVNNNLFGDREFCPMVRKTETLLEFEKKDLSSLAKKLMKSVDPAILIRAANYLYTKETKSSFGIEKIKPDLKRTGKFISLLEEAHTIPSLDKEILLKLQNNIVDEEYKDTDYRKTQNYVGELTHLYNQRIHYISPRPEDISSLMAAFISCENRLIDSNTHPVVIAAVLAFAFVFLHPFEDGNGRIHRFLIHYVLSKTGFAPDNIIFPVSSVMLKNIAQYDEELERFSKPLLAAINKYELNDQGELSVQEETKFHYQYIDYTHYAEYLFYCIDSIIKEDFKEELDFIVKYDRTKTAIQNIIDMPDIKIDRVIRCIAQNNGTLGKKMRRTHFSELTDKTISDIEIVVNENMLEK